MRFGRTRWLLPVGVAAGALVIMASGCPPAPQPQLHSQAYFCTGSPQSFQVPPGVSVVAVHAYGAQGGSNEPGTRSGGLGGRAIGALSVAPGQNVGVVVGCAGGNGTLGVGGFGFGVGGNGGGGEAGAGGGGSAVSNGAALIVGGGGGGAGDTNGGFGGFPNGAPGDSTFGGGGGTQTAPGAGGGAGGQPGSGSNGGEGNNNGNGGGGGGGGFFGGGGGGDSYGGGGGSSTGPNGTSFQNAAQSGNGVVVLFWNA